MWRKCVGLWLSVARGINSGILFVSKADTNERKEPTMDTNTIKAAEQCLIDNGIETDEVQNVLQALGYILLDEELYED